MNVRKISRIGKQNVWIHGELKQTNEQNTKVELSSYPLVLVGLPLAVILLAVSINIINLLLDSTIPLIDKLNSFLFMFGFYFVSLGLYLGLFFLLFQ